MRICVDIDDRLLKRAMQLTGLPGRQAVIEQALAELVKRKSCEALSDAFGKYPSDTDPEELDDAPKWVADAVR